MPIRFRPRPALQDAGVVPSYFTLLSELDRLRFRLVARPCGKLPNRDWDYAEKGFVPSARALHETGARAFDVQTNPVPSEVAYGRDTGKRMKINLSLLLCARLKETRDRPGIL